MMMDLNPYVLGLLGVLLLIFLIVYFRRNKKDLRSYAETLNASETDPEKHPGEDSNVKH